MPPGRSAVFVRSLLLSGLTGGLLALAGPPLSSHWAAALLAFLFAPLLALLIRSQTPARSGLLGLAAGLGFGVISLRFAFDVLLRFAGLGTLAALPVFLLLVVLQSAPLVLALFVARLSDTSESTRLPLTLPLAIAASFGLVPVLFPWHVGHFTLPWLAWAQLAELGGLPLVDLLTAQVGCLVLGAWELRAHGQAKRAGAFALGALLLLGLPLAFGSMRLVDVAAAREQAAVLRVGVVQPDVSIRALREGMTTSARLARLETLSRDAAEQGAQVVLWPEAAYPVLVSRAALLDREAGTLRFDGPDLPHIVGAMSADLTDASGCRRWNTLVATDMSGRPSGHVDKRQRFPFAEYIPFWSWSSWLQARYACPGEQVGEGDALLTVAGAPLGLLNCYEDVGPGPARAATLAGAELLLNVSNDAWFGRSVQPELHRIVARFRAIETRRDLVRAVNTGRSGHISATGEELVVLPRHERGVFVASARRLTGTSLSVHLGSWVPPLAVALLLLLALLPLARRQSARQSLESRA